MDERVITLYVPEQDYGTRRLIYLRNSSQTTRITHHIGPGNPHKRIQRNYTLMGSFYLPSSFSAASHIATILSLFVSSLKVKSNENFAGLEISRLEYSISLRGISCPFSSLFFLRLNAQAMAPQTRNSSWLTMSTPIQVRRPYPNCECPSSFGWTVRGSRYVG